MKNTPDNFSCNTLDETRAFLKKHDFSIAQSISIEQARTLSQWIVDENKQGSCMVEKCPNTLYQAACEHGCIAISQHGVMVGFMGLYRFADMYEAGTLIVDPAFRKL